MLTIYGHPRSRTSRVLWALEELELPYELKLVHLHKGEHLKEDFVRLNPDAKIPVMQDGDFVLTESGAILNYLADRNADRLRLIPEVGTRERALHDQWTFFALNELEPTLWAWFRETLVREEGKRSADLLKLAQREFPRAAAVVSGHFERSGSAFLLGENFSVADISMMSILKWGHSIDLPGVDQTLSKYIERTEAREGYQRMLAKYPRN